MAGFWNPQTKIITRFCMKPFIIITLLTLAAGLDAAAQLPVREDKTLSAKVDKLLLARFKPDGPGCAILIARKGDVIYRKAYGMADLELNVPATPDNVFRIASISKQFTAVAILQLMEKGQLKLDDDIRKFITDYPVKGQPITISNLLSHTSGIKNITEIELPPITRWEDHSPQALVDMIKALPPDFEPGTANHYSNSGYILLGYIIEKVTGKSYEQYITENIFKPANMDHARYDNARTVIANRAKGYREISNTETINADYLNMSFPYAAGGLMMTVDDLLKWNKALNENRLIKKETLTLATTPFTLTNHKKTTYGFGWGLDSLAGSPTRQHGGSIDGFSSFQIYLPAEDVYVVVLSNGANKNTMVPALLAASLAANKKNINEIQLTDNMINSYVGVYEFPNNAATVTVLKKDGKLFLKDSRSPEPWEMHFTTPQDFFCYEVFPNNHLFTFDSAKRVDSFIIQAGGEELKVKRIK